jgi:hypothetical protein
MAIIGIAGKFNPLNSGRNRAYLVESVPLPKLKVVQT